MNLFLCDGNYPARQVCGSGNTQCCLSCIPEDDGEILDWGDDCGPDIIGTCAQGYECRNEQCLRIKGMITFGNRCVDSSECAVGTSENQAEVLICREVSGKGRICSFALASRYCSSNQECIDATGNPEATCVADECQVPESEPEIVGEAAEIERCTPFDYCSQVPASQRSACTTCINSGKENEKIFTAVGCVSVSGEELAADLIKLLLGVGGGVALLSMLAAAFRFTISKGDSGQIKEAKELMTASITGLLFIIFSVIILQFVGVQILHIPGLG